MNSAHIHLLVNHVSIFGVFFGLIALVWALVRKSAEMRMAAMLLFLISGLFSFIATETGEGAEEIAEDLPGVSESIIEAHEESAEAANVATIVLAVGGVLMGSIGKFKTQLLKPGQMVVLVLALISSGLLVQTAKLGGQIRHTEIRPDAQVPAGENGPGSNGDSASDDH